MRLPEGPGWSPDGGKFWVKGDLLYWHDGTIWDMRDGCIIRSMHYDHDEDYSAWSDDKRAAVLAENRAEYAKIKAEDDCYNAERTRLRESARAKLTPEEIEACNLEDDDDY